MYAVGYFVGDRLDGYLEHKDNVSDWKNEQFPRLAFKRREQEDIPIAQITTHQLQTPRSDGEVTSDDSSCENFNYDYWHDYYCQDELKETEKEEIDGFVLV
jgi:hypothetical protein